MKTIKAVTENVHEGLVALIIDYAAANGMTMFNVEACIDDVIEHYIENAEIKCDDQ